MNNDDDALSSVYKKIERERALLNAANQMRQSTQNEQVKARLDTQMREGRRNIQYLEERMQELQMRRVGSGMDNMNISSSTGQDQGRQQYGASARTDSLGGPPAPPPKDTRGAPQGSGYGGMGDDRGDYGSQNDYSQIGGHGNVMPPRHPYAPPAPGQGMPRSRPNYTKLGRHIIDYMET